MDICGEHGDDIAFYGRDCPACGHVETLEKDHRYAIEELENSHKEEVDDLQNELDKALET